MMVRVLAVLAGLLLASNAWAQAVPKATTPAPVVPKTTTPTPPQVTPKATTQTPAAAATPLPAAIIGVVDLTQVRNNSLAAKDIQRQMAAIQEVYSAEISKLE